MSAPWFLARDLKPSARDLKLPVPELHRTPPVRLFCLPHAGAGAASFYRLKTLLAPAIAVCPVLLPGRDTRIGETARTRMPDLIAELTDAAVPWLSEPYAIFGHSMGSLIAYAWARELERRGLPQPRALIVSGRNAPHLSAPHRTLHTLDDLAFLDELQQRYGGLPAAFLEDDDLLQTFLPVLRADLELVETYDPSPEPPLPVAITACAGEDDHSVSPAGLAAWSTLTRSTCSVHRFAGGHFAHLQQSQAALATILKNALLIAQPSSEA